MKLGDHRLYSTPIREHHAPFGFETRGVKCPDGITRLLAYPRHIWDWHDHFQEIKLFGESKTDEVAECWNLANKRHPDNPSKDFITQFYLKIIIKYHAYNGG